LKNKIYALLILEIGTICKPALLSPDFRQLGSGEVERKRVGVIVALLYKLLGAYLAVADSVPLPLPSNVMRSAVTVEMFPCASITEWVSPKLISFIPSVVIILEATLSLPDAL
jgi:hypothetical protein